MKILDKPDYFESIKDYVTLEDSSESKTLEI